MGKKTKSSADAETSPAAAPSKRITAASSFDASLASLFASSAGPVKAPQPKPAAPVVSKRKAAASEDAPESESESQQSEGSLAELEDAASVEEEEEEETDPTPPKKRRKTKEADDLESRYLDRLAREEAREDRANGEEKPVRPAGQDGATVDRADDVEDDDIIPQHETATNAHHGVARDIAKRTVFLGNVSVEAIKSKSAKKTLLDHLSSVLTDLPGKAESHKIESLRFRSTAYADAGIPKKAAFAKRELMETTTKSTNAYVVYSTEAAARKSSRLLNGTVVLQRHLRADHVAHPMAVDNKRCIFVGNLDFVDEETVEEPQDGQEKKKPKKAGDVEEGLWQTFNKAGPVESVRVVRDPVTRVGKGFAYVQFKDENGVEAALLFNEKKFPPLLPRKVRVSRARRIPKVIQREKKAARGEGMVKRPKKQDRERGPKRSESGGANAGAPGIRKPESFVFEGHRASSNSDKMKLHKTKKSDKRSAKRPDNRGSRRAAAFKESGGKRKRSED